MSDFWTLDSLKSALGGTWVARPVEGTPPGEVSGVSTDSRSVRPGEMFVALRGARTDGHEHLHAAAAAGAALLVIDRVPEGRPVPEAPCILRVPDTSQALLRLASRYRRTLTSTRVIAVGGSNGKTTTVRVLGQVLAAAMPGTCSPRSFNNAVGVPLTILSARPTDRFLVCEVGTNAPGEIAPLADVIEPDIVVITSIGREHLEGLGSLEGVVREEASLARSIRVGGLCIVSADAPGLAQAVAPLVAAQGAQLLTIGFHEHADLCVCEVVQGPAGLRFTLNDRSQFTLPLLGRHNASNAAAVIAVARRLGVPPETIRAALAVAKGPPMRLEPVEVRGIRFINDAYNANPESVLAALDAFALACPPPAGTRQVVILGEMLEKGAAGPALHAEVGRAVAEVHPDLLIAVGELSRETVRTAAARGLAEARITHLPDLDDGRDAAIGAMLRPGDAVLLKASRGVRLERVLEAARTPPTATLTR
jgi:UDP-N-acetylmuramoyl-tripeptide--D-alanyl-D-alanine ligase